MERNNVKTFEINKKTWFSSKPTISDLGIPRHVIRQSSFDQIFQGLDKGEQDEEDEEQERRRRKNKKSRKKKERRKKRCVNLEMRGEKTQARVENNNNNNNNIPSQGMMAPSTLPRGAWSCGPKKRNNI